MPFRRNRSLVVSIVIAVIAAGLISAAVVPSIVAQTSAPQSLSAIKTQAEFDSLAVTYDPDTPTRCPICFSLSIAKTRTKSIT